MTLKSHQKLTYSITRAAEVCDLSEYTVDYLCRSGVVVPAAGQKPGRGVKRQYSFNDLLLLRVVARLLKQGLTVAHLKKGFEQLSQLHPDISIPALGSRFLVTDGHRLFFRNDCNFFEDLTGKGQLVFAFVIDLAGVEAELDARLTTKKGLPQGRVADSMAETCEGPGLRTFGRRG